MRSAMIYKWRTTRVVGHESRDKFHLCLFSKDNQHYFLFLNSKSKYADEEYILKGSNYEFLTRDKSFVLCSFPLRYNTSDIPESLIECGSLIDSDITGFRSQVEASEVMEEWIIEEILETFHDC